MQAIYLSICCIFWRVFGCWVLDNYTIITIHLPILTLYCYLMFHPFCTKKRVFAYEHMFFLGIKILTIIWVRAQKYLFSPHFASFLAVLFSSFLAWKTLKRQVSTSVWSAQHPNTCQNIQPLLPPIGGVIFSYSQNVPNDNS